MKNFKIGNIVKIVDGGSCYDSYSVWAIKHGLNYWKSHLIGYGEQPGLYTVIVKAIHGTNSQKQIYGIENNKTGEQIIMGERGLEIVKISDPLPKELFEI